MGGRREALLDASRLCRRLASSCERVEKSRQKSEVTTSRETKDANSSQFEPASTNGSQIGPIHQEIGNELAEVGAELARCFS